MGAVAVLDGSGPYGKARGPRSGEPLDRLRGELSLVRLQDEGLAENHTLQAHVRVVRREWVSRSFSSSPAGSTNEQKGHSCFLVRRIGPYLDLIAQGASLR